MSLKKYVITNFPMSLLETATRALRAIWADRFVVHHATIARRRGPNWIVRLLVQVHFKTPYCHGWTHMDVSVHVSESLRWATDNGPILVEVRERDGDVTSTCAKVLVWKDCYDPGNPLDAFGRMYVRESDLGDLAAIEQVVHFTGR